MNSQGKLDESLMKKLQPSGSQPPRLYGLAKIHKDDVPLRPVLSMPGSPYHKIALQISEWLSVVEECKINSSTKEISDSLQDIRLPIDHVLVSFDVTSLYTNVPVLEAIEHCTDLLYAGKYREPPVNRATFVELLKICSSNVIMQTNEGYFRQIDGLAMGSPPAPHLANGWLSKYDQEIKGDAKLFTRYMDDILRDIKNNAIAEKLEEINNIHPSLKFTHEEENENSIAFLDMKLTRLNESLCSTWYTKPTDTGLTINFHASTSEVQEIWCVGVGTSYFQGVQ